MGVCLRRNARLAGLHLLCHSAVLRKQPPFRLHCAVSSAALVEDHVFDEIPEVETWKPALTYRLEGRRRAFEGTPEAEAWKPAVTWGREDGRHVFDENPEVENLKHEERSKCRLFSLVGRVLKSLNWEVAWRIRFQRVVNEHGFEDSVVALRGMQLEVYALLTSCCHSIH